MKKNRLSLQKPSRLTASTLLIAYLSSVYGCGAPLGEEDPMGEIQMAMTEQFDTQEDQGSASPALVESLAEQTELDEDEQDWAEPSEREARSSNGWGWISPWKALLGGAMILSTVGSGKRATPSTGLIPSKGVQFNPDVAQFTQPPSALARMGEKLGLTPEQLVPRSPMQGEPAANVADRRRLANTLVWKTSTQALYKAGNEFQVNTYTVGEQRSPSVAALSGGGFVATWYSNGQDGSNYGVYGQVFDANANKLGNEFQVNTYTSGEQSSPSVVSLSGGGFVVTWRSSGQDGSSWGVFGQVFDAQCQQAGQ